MGRYTHNITSISLFILILITSVGLTTLGVNPAFAAPVGQNNQFQPDSCMFDLPAGAVEGTDVVCGYLTVPEEHSQPGGPTIRLAVAIIKSRDPNPKADPLFVAQGGPGGSTIETYAVPLLSNSELRADRDIVLFDQRGTLYSKPDLYCNEIDQLTADTIEKVLTREETEKLNLLTLTACRERLSQEGINLSAFDSLENAHDIESLRLALGYERINLYGVSYGTLLALHYMHNYPGSLRSVILDGVVPPQTNFILGSAKTMDQSFSHLMEACRMDEACNQQYPDLENVFFKLVDQLNQTPARLSITDPETGTVYHEAAVDGDTFMSAIFQFLYIADLIPALPRMIYDAQQGDFSVLARILSIIVFDRSMSYGMYYSVVCSEEVNFTPADHDLSGVRPIIAEIEQRTPQSLLDICKHWDVVPLDPQVDQPFKSDIPTLLLSGGFDPITPPEYAASVASTLTNSYSFTFPTGGHGQMLDDDCPNSIILAFLDNPARAPDSSCIDKGALPDFITSQNTLDLPVVTQLLNLAPVATFGFLSVMMLQLFMWTSVLVFPLAWLIGRPRQKTGFSPIPTYSGPEVLDASYSPGDQDKPERHPSFLLRISSWLPVFASAALSLFWLAFIIFLVIMITKNDNRLFYGLTKEAQPWFALILIFLLLCLTMLAAAVLGWVQRYGPLWRRVYYTLLTLAGFLILVILAAWGMLTILL